MCAFADGVAVAGDGVGALGDGLFVLADGGGAGEDDVAVFLMALVLAATAAWLSLTRARVRGGRRSRGGSTARQDAISDGVRRQVLSWHSPHQ